MVITPHILISAALSKSVQNIYLLPFVSFFFHFLIDLIPHWDYRPFEETFISQRPIRLWRKKGLFIIAADYLTAVSVIFIIGFFYDWRMLDYELAFLASFFGILPDIIAVYIKFYSVKNKFALMYRRFHEKVHFIKVDDFNKGFYQQIAVSIIAIIIIILT